MEGDVVMEDAGAAAAGGSGGGAAESHPEMQIRLAMDAKTKGNAAFQ